MTPQLSGEHSKLNKIYANSYNTLQQLSSYWKGTKNIYNGNSRHIR